jgi:hypothetical protein
VQEQYGRAVAAGAKCDRSRSVVHEHPAIMARMRPACVPRS